MRKLNGGACGIASRATTKPVLQTPTKTQGIAASQACWRSTAAMISAPWPGSPLRVALELGAQGTTRERVLGRAGKFNGTAIVVDRDLPGAGIRAVVGACAVNGLHGVAILTCAVVRVAAIVPSGLERGTAYQGRAAPLTVVRAAFESSRGANMSIKSLTRLAAVACMLHAATSSALQTRPVLSLDLAKRMADACEALAAAQVLGVV